MAVVFDSATQAAGTYGGSSNTFSFTNTAGDAIAVMPAWNGTPTCDSVTYNGVALTRVASTQVTGGGCHAEIWTLAAPATGTHDVVITYSTAMSGDNLAGAISASGVDQTTPMYAGNTASVASTVDVSAATGDLVVDCMVYGGAAPTVGSGQTQQWAQAGVGTHSAKGSSEAGAATTTMSWTGAGTALAITAAAFKSAPISAVVTGTASDGAIMSEIVAGGETLVCTLSGDTFDGTLDSTDFDNIRDGLVSSGSETHGWNNDVIAAISSSDFTQDNDHQITLVLPAVASYVITASETIEWTIPGSVLTGASPLVATPTFTIVAPGVGGISKLVGIGGGLVG